MSHTALFFGDSNTRGYGVGRERRFSSLIEKAVASTIASEWRFVVAGTQSDFRMIPDRLEKAVVSNHPDIVVWQIPTGPCAYFPRYPRWLRPLRTVYEAVFERWLESRIRGDVTRRGGVGESMRQEALYEGLYLDRAFRWRPSAWPGTRHVNSWLAARYGLEVKATRERYLELVVRYSDRMRALSDARQLILGLLLHSDDMFPGYCKRALAWGRDLDGLLHQPERGRFYLELCAPLMQAGAARNLLHDGTHLSVDGHRCVADLVTPLLQSLLAERGGPAGARESRDSAT